MATYVTITCGDLRLAVIDFADGGPGVSGSRYVTPPGNTIGLVTDTGTGFRGQAPGTREHADTWYGVARVFLTAQSN